MIDPRREREGGTVKPGSSQQKQASKQQDRSKTEGTNRDFDESQQSDNQGHGHPREERSTTRD
ncbi:MAG TPA: hypothetical protein VHG09_13940 [Longimicrobiales bacterium]|nr:hypothetical protein [Longimicrobiales bacterium]